MVTIKTSYQSNNKNHTIINLIRYNKKITIKSITKIQTHVRLIKKIKNYYRRNIKKKLAIS